MLAAYDTFDLLSRRRPQQAAQMAYEIAAVAEKYASDTPQSKGQNQ